MTLNIVLDQESEQVLREEAAGEDLSTYITRMVKNLAKSSRSARRKPGEFAERMRAWSRLHPVRDQLIDDSREAIYKGCGE